MPIAFHELTLVSSFLQLFKYCYEQKKNIGIFLIFFFIIKHEKFKKYILDNIFE